MQPPTVRMHDVGARVDVIERARVHVARLGRDDHRRVLVARGEHIGE